MDTELMLFERGGCAVVSSRVIAERFDKRHHDVVNIIEGKIKNLTTKNFVVSNYFISSTYIHLGNSYREYLLTRDGFSFIVMGFTGIEADVWKLKYIEAFNLMEQALRERQSTEWLVTRRQGKLLRRGETDALALLVPYAKSQGSQNMDKQVYQIYTKLVNSLVGLEAGQRENAPFKTLSTIMFLEDMILHTVAECMQQGIYYKEIYMRCKANGEQIMRFAYLPGLAS